uniref:Uncharacterized protein n=1 Tax=Arundo donax TaxID=35708 RepID=A0A0A9H8A5_ARUDO
MLGLNGPASWLSETSTSWRLRGSVSGNAPDRAFECRSRNSRLTHPEMAAGTGPTRWFSLMSTKLRFLRLPISAGMVPDSRLPLSRSR